jgi:hypothetical protein
MLPETRPVGWRRASAGSQNCLRRPAAIDRHSRLIRLMIPKAREVRLKPKVRKVLEARCRAPTAAQRDVRRARIVLLAAEGRSTRSIAAEVDVQPRIVSHWAAAVCGSRSCRVEGPSPGRQEADLRPGHEQAHSGASGEAPPPQGYARWTGPLLAKAKPPYHSTLIPGASMVRISC